MNLSDYNLIFASQRCLIGISRISSAGTNPRNTNQAQKSSPPRNRFLTESFFLVSVALKPAGSAFKRQDLR